MASEVVEELEVFQEDQNNLLQSVKSYQISTFPPDSPQITSTILLLLGPEGEEWPDGWLPWRHPTLNNNNIKQNNR